MTRVLSIFLILSAGYASAETYVGQVHVQTRAEGIVIALDLEGDGGVDHIFIADGVKLAAAFAGRANVNVGEAYIQVVPSDGSSGLQYIVGKPDNGPIWPTRHGYSSLHVRGLIHYSGPVVEVPLAELDSWAVPRPSNVEDDRPAKPVELDSLPGFGENRGPYVGQTRIVPREGGALIAVDDSKSHDGLADVVLVVMAPEPIEPWTGRALVEVTDAGIRVVDIDNKFRVLMSFLPKEIQNHTGRRVAVPLSQIESLDFGQP